MADKATGLGVDASGAPVVDPTKNVLDLVAAGAQRADDLRELNDRRIDAEIRVIAAKLEGIEHRMILRDTHAREIRLLEADRLEKIRQVDVLAGNTAADRALVAIQTLAASTTTTAETLRTMASETVMAQNTRIAQLEKSSYEGAGKGTGAKNLWFVIAAVITVLGFMLLAGGTLISVALYVSR
jgi:hypothetical protein